MGDTDLRMPPELRLDLLDALRDGMVTTMCQLSWTRDGRDENSRARISLVYCSFLSCH